MNNTNGETVQKNPRATAGLEVDEVRVEKLSRAIEAILRREDKRLWLKAFALARSRSAAEELVQTTCYRAWTHVDQFDAERGAHGWLATIMRTQFIDERRRHCNRNVSLDIPVPDSDDGLVFTLADGDPTPEAALLEVEKRGEAAALVDLVAGLRPHYRDAISAVTLGGESLKSAAARLGIPMATLKSRLSRARAILRSTVLRGEHGQQ